MRISEVLSRKPTGGVVTISPDATVDELLAVLAEHNIGACVVGATDQILGIVSERDVVRRLHDHGAGALTARVADVMTAEPATCGPDDTLEELLEVMTQLRVRHLPVLDDDALVGIVSIGDLVKFRIDQLTFERDQLDSYMHQV